MKIWITKYALTQGVYAVEADLPDEPGGTMIAFTNDRGFREYFHKPHWHATKPVALERAEEMRKKKLASLRKQIEKLESLEFH